jgi:hypothetical protein
MDRCRTELPPLEIAGEAPDHLSRCWLPHNVAARQALRVKLDQSLPVSAEA